MCSLFYSFWTDLAVVKLNRFQTSSFTGSEHLHSLYTIAAATRKTQMSWISDGSKSVMGCGAASVVLTLDHFSVVFSVNVML